MASPNRLRRSKNNPQARKPLYVAGIGASAGGLEAMTELLTHVPEHTGIAYVFVYHFPATQKSMMAELLRSKTSLEAKEAEDGEVLRPGYLYVMPSKFGLRIQRGKLKLIPRGRNGLTPIDSFFMSLAKDQGKKSIGIILSGSGVDGAKGIEAIKAAGGITFAEEEASAAYSSMPISAKATHAVDHVLSPAAIGRTLSNIEKTRSAEPRVMAMGKKRLDPYVRILEMIRGRVGIDFTSYKQPTVHRRIARRMRMHKIKDIAQYVRRLKNDSREVETLGEDILINVTDFFRDPPLYATLKQKVFPQLLKRRAAESAVRIWVPGCSTKEPSDF